MIEAPDPLAKFGKRVLAIMRRAYLSTLDTEAERERESFNDRIAAIAELAADLDLAEITHDEPDLCKGWLKPVTKGGCRF